jgi:hypothetical protein
MYRVPAGDLLRTRGFTTMYYKKNKGDKLKGIRNGKPKMKKEARKL